MPATARNRCASALAAVLVGIGSLSLAGCGDGDAGTVQERQVDGSHDIGDAGLAPEEAAGGAGGTRGTGDEAG